MSYPTVEMKNLIVLPLLVIAFSIAYYLIVYLPQYNSAVLKNQEAIVQMQIYAENQRINTKKVELDNCLEVEREIFLRDLTLACKGLGHWIDKENRCDIYGYVSDKSNMSKLSFDSYKERQNECYKKFPQN